MGLKAIPMQADSGPIGRDLSHEFIVLAATGESQVYYDAGFEEIDWLEAAYRYRDADDLERFFEQMTSMYAATDEKHDDATFQVLPEARRRAGRGIEVGHIFYFGTRYSTPMGLSLAGPDGQPIVPHMGSYGIGVSRLVGGIIEASHDDAGIVWPDSVAPWKVGILNLKPGDAVCDRITEALYEKFGAEALLDDRDERPGAKFADADLMGHPWQLIVGPRSASAGEVELKRRATGERATVSLDSALTRILG
jgi:prolyl-tRNA synthetase